MNFQTICRICIGESPEMLSIFESHNFSTSNCEIFEAITYCASVEIQQFDGFSEQICRRCLDHLSQAYSFKKLCEESDYKFRNSLISSDKIEIKTEFTQDDTKIIYSEVANNITGNEYEISSKITDLEVTNVNRDEDPNVLCNKSLTTTEDLALRMKLPVKQEPVDLCKEPDYEFADDSSNETEVKSDMDDDDDDDEIALTPRSSANSASIGLLPNKSRSLYEKTYSEFISWRTDNRITGHSESVLLAYFAHVSKRGLIASLWPKYSMLKSTLHLKENIDISKFNKLNLFIKKKQEGYKPKKSKVLEKEHVEKFISDAPNNLFLSSKVALIFGVAGAMKQEELLKLEAEDVQDLGTKFLVTLKNSKRIRIFTILDNDQSTLLNLIRAYISLRPAHTRHKRFFIFYKNNRCSTQPIGINTFSKIPSRIAAFLKLDEPHLYTGHCFRRSSAIK